LERRQSLALEPELSQELGFLGRGITAKRGIFEEFGKSWLVRIDAVDILFGWPGPSARAPAAQPCLDDRTNAHPRFRSFTKIVKSENISETDLTVSVNSLSMVNTSNVMYASQESMDCGQAAVTPIPA
jgi:hypothetical protein